MAASNSIRRLFPDEPSMFTLGKSNSKGELGYATLRITWL